MKNQIPSLRVVTDHNREVPLGPPVKSQILQNQHRVTRRQFCQHALKLAVQRIDQHPVGPSTGDHLNLQGTFPAGDVNQVFENFRIGRKAPAVQHHGQ